MTLTTCPECAHTVDPEVSRVILVSEADNATVLHSSCVICMSCKNFLMLTEDGARLATAEDYAHLDPLVRAGLLKIPQWLRFTPEAEGAHVASTVRAALTIERCSVLLDFLACNVIERAVSSPEVFHNHRSPPKCPRCLEPLSPLLSLMGREPRLEGAHALIVCQACASLIGFVGGADGAATIGPLDVADLAVPAHLEPILLAVIDTVKNSLG